MPLTKEEQAALQDLQEKERAPEPRTDTGVAGVLHALIDSASGQVPHRGADAWAELHRQAEDLAETKPETKPDKATDGKATGTKTG